jgi:hypothetical protein
MTDFLHRVKVFVFRLSAPEPDYLLLRSAQGIEGFWGPVQGNIGFDEKLENAIRREVERDTGIARPLDLIDLQMPARWTVGDEEVIEWHFGFRAGPGADELQLAPHLCDFQWAGFSNAYPSLEMEADRAAIMRLHTLLHDAA